LTLQAQAMLSNVSLGTANALSYLMLVVVAVFLLSGPAIYYIFSRKNKKATPVEPSDHP
jgi:preprotein translocase subunit SecG